MRDCAAILLLPAVILLAAVRASGAEGSTPAKLQELEIRSVQHGSFSMKTMARGNEYENDSDREMFFRMKGIGEGFIRPAGRISLPKSGSGGKAVASSPYFLELVKGGMRLNLSGFPENREFVIKSGEIILRIPGGAALGVSNKGPVELEISVVEGKAEILLPDGTKTSVPAASSAVVSGSVATVENLSGENLLLEKALDCPLSAFPLEMELVGIPAMTLPAPEPEMRIVTGAEIVDGKGMVKLEAYWIGKYEVLNRQWRLFEKWFELTRSHRYCHPAEPAGCEHIQVQEEGECYSELYKDDHPVVGLSWWDAFAFCWWAGGRLPNELEWMVAGYWQKGKWAPFPWGSAGEKDHKIGKYANYEDLDFLRWQQQNGIPWESLDGKSDERDGFPTSSPAGKFPEGKSVFGVFDMAGNVSEWVYAGGTAGGKAARGGNWGFPFDGTLSKGIRLEFPPENPTLTVGLRLLKEQDFYRQKQKKEKKDEKSGK